VESPATARGGLNSDLGVQSLSADSPGEVQDPRKTLPARTPHDAKAIGDVVFLASLECKQEGGRSMQNATILVVDDVPRIRRVLRTSLCNSGYDVILAKKGQEAIGMVIRERPNLILLDVNMSGEKGFQTYSKIRVLFDGPIVVVAHRNSERGKIAALDAGADDVVVKPFAIGELLARIRSALRKSAAEELLPKIDTPELTVDLEKRIVYAFGKNVYLTPKEFDLVRVLVIHRGKALSHERVMQAVWGPDHTAVTANLRVLIKQLRNKIEKDPAQPRYIVTEPWLGYRFELPSKTPEKRSRGKL
jgi:two-component system KDP operon response regulator KdpE